MPRISNEDLTSALDHVNEATACLYKAQAKLAAEDGMPHIDESLEGTIKRARILMYALKGEIHQRSKA